MKKTRVLNLMRSCLKILTQKAYHCFAPMTIHPFLKWNNRSMQQSQTAVKTPVLSLFLRLIQIWQKFSPALYSLYLFSFLACSLASALAFFLAAALAFFSSCSSKNDSLSHTSSSFFAFNSISGCSSLKAKSDSAIYRC